MPVDASPTSPPRLTRFVPILDWSRTYDRRWLRSDLIAGVAVAAMIVPKDLGYAGIAGIPVENGLYAAAAAAIIYGIFCTSRHISTGPSSSLAAVAGGAVLVTGMSGTEAAQLVAAIAIVTGALFLLVAILKLGWLASFLSRAVVTGFLAGAAIDVVIGELPKLTGTSADGVNAWQEFASWVRGLGDLSPATLLVGLVALAVILGLRFTLPRVPGALVLVVGGLLASVLFDLGARGVALVGPVPRGLPLPQVPSLELVSQNLPAIVIASFALLLIGFSQTAGDAQAFATKHRYRVDLDQESVAQGMANLGAGVFQGMPVSTSLSASSLNESAGARTPVASLATGGIVLATLILLAPLFSELPKAVLAAIIIDAVVFGMIDLAEFRRLRRVKRFDFWIAVAAVLGVLSVGVLLGVVVGIVLSLLWLINVATRPSMPILGREAGHAGVPGSRRASRGRNGPRRGRDPHRRRPVLRHGGGAGRSGPRDPREPGRAAFGRAGPRGRELRGLARCGEVERAARADRRQRRRAAAGPPEARRVRRAGGGRAHRPDRAQARSTATCTAQWTPRRRRLREDPWTRQICPDRSRQRPSVPCWAREFLTAHGRTGPPGGIRTPDLLIRSQSL